MNERLIEIYRSCRSKEALASQDEYNSANALLGSEVEKFAEMLLLECIDLVETTPKHCAYTTFQLGIVECTVQKASERLHEHFGIQRQYKITSGQLPVSK